jgi:hypothetical protein
MLFSTVSYFFVGAIFLKSALQLSHANEISLVLQKIKPPGLINERGKRKATGDQVKYKFNETFFRSPQFNKFYTALQERAKGEPTWVELQSLTDSIKNNPPKSVEKRQIFKNAEEKDKRGMGQGLFLKFPDLDKSLINELSAVCPERVLDQPIKIECPAMVKSRDCTPKPCCFCGEPLKPSCDDYEWKWCRISIPRKPCCSEFNGCANLMVSSTGYPVNKKTPVPDFSFDVSNEVSTSSPSLDSARNKALYYLMRRSSEGGNTFPLLKFLNYSPSSKIK